MAKGITIGVASDTRDFSRGIKSGVVEPLDGVADVLSDMVKEGDKAGDHLNRTFLEQQQSTKELRRDYQKLNDEIAEGSNRSRQATSKNVQGAARETSESVKTVKEETLANASETFSSFDGSAQSFADGLQGVFGGVVADLGPIGAAAGAAGALGIGLISTAIQNGQEDAEAFKQDVSDLADDLVTTGSRGSASLEKVVSVLQDLATGQDSAGNSLSKLEDLASETGVDFKELAQAYAGSGRGIAALIRYQKEHLAQLRETQRQNQIGAAGYQQATSSVDKQVDAQEKLITTLEQTSRKQKAAAKDQKAYIDSGAESLDLAAQAAGNYASDVQSAYEQAGADVKDYVDKGVFNLDEYQKAMEKNAAAIVDYQANMATATKLLGKSGHDAAITYLESLGPDAAPLIAAFIKAPAAQQTSLEQTWDTLGAAASTSFGTSLQTNLSAKPATQKVNLIPDDSAVVNKLAFLKNTKIPVSLIPTTNGSGVKKN